MGDLAVLGLDAMPWSYLNKLAEAGAIPFIANLLPKTFRAELEAFPPVTVPSWTGIMTGLHPGYHGIHSFFRYDGMTWNQHLYTSLDLKRPRIHEIL